MNYTSQSGRIEIKISATNAGKFRFKTRENSLLFGEIFSTREIPFLEKSYLEWQIGYDTTLKDFASGKKITLLKDRSFIGANKKEKYPFELGEFLHSALKEGLINVHDLESLLNEVQNYTKFIGDNKIEVEDPKDTVLNEMSFKETSIRLPTYFFSNTPDGTQIEVTIQKQQYASGVQPMVYFAIPLQSFGNYKELLGKTSERGQELVYVFDKSNVSVLSDMVRIFGMCTPSHKHDIVEILKVLLAIAK